MPRSEDGEKLSKHKYNSEDPPFILKVIITIGKLGYVDAKAILSNAMRTLIKTGRSQQTTQGIKFSTHGNLVECHDAVCFVLLVNTNYQIVNFWQSAVQAQASSSLRHRGIKGLTFQLVVRPSRVSSFCLGKLLG